MVPVRSNDRQSKACEVSQLDLHVAASALETVRRSLPDRYLSETASSHVHSEGSVAAETTQRNNTTEIYSFGVRAHARVIVNS